MAETLQASISLQDKMSNVLRNVSTVLGTVIDQFDALDTASDQPLNVEDLNRARSILGDINNEIGEMDDHLDRATRSQQQLDKSVEDTTHSSNQLLDTLKKVAVTIGAMYGAKWIMDTSTELTNIEARLNNINDGAQTTAELMNKVYASANRSYAGFTDVASAVAKLAGQTGKLFGSTDEVIAFTELLNKAFTIGGTSAEGKASAMLQLTQAMSSGVLRGEEFNALNENAGQLVQTIADYMGVEKGAMKELASEGKITAEIIKNAIFSAGNDIDETFNAMPITFEDVKTKIGNMALQIFTPFWKELEKFVNSKEMQKFINGISQALAILGSIMVATLKIFVGAFNWITDNWSTLGPLFLGLAGAVLIYAGATAYLAAQKKLLVFWEAAGKIAAIASHTVTAVGIILTGLMTGATLAEVNSKILATGATITLTAAEYALLAPLLLIIVIFVAIIGVIYLVVAAYNYLTGSSISATGIIVGAFYWLYAAIYNIFAWIWNIFVEVAEFLADVFSDPIYYLRLAFGEMGKAVLKVFKSVATGVEWLINNIAIPAINALIDAYNAIPFVSNIGKIDKIDMTSGFDDKIAEIDKWIGEKTTPDHDFDDYKVEYKDMGEYFNKGYEAGKGIEDSISGMFDLNKKAEGLTDMDAFDYESMLDGMDMDGMTDGLDTSGLEDGVNGIDSNTGKIADSMEATEEDLKYLIDIAKKNREDRITNVDITIPITNNNTMNSDADLTGMVDYMTQQLTVKVQEAVEMTAEGVHQ